MTHPWQTMLSSMCEALQKSGRLKRQLNCRHAPRGCHSDETNSVNGVHLTRCSALVSGALAIAAEERSDAQHTAQRQPLDVPCWPADIACSVTKCQAHKILVLQILTEWKYLRRGTNDSGNLCQPCLCDM
jgi:hypothetical protein